MSDESVQTTLRDHIEQAIETVEPVDTVETPSSNRPRDESGRFAPKQEEQVELKPEGTQVEQADQATEAPKFKPRPSSWKKDYEDHWSKLDPTLQDYIAQREQDYAKGVSTYKQNWDNAAPIYEAIQPFMPDLQQHNINPAQWIQNLGTAHKTLAMGSPEEKLHMFAKLANDYGVPLQALTGQQYDPQFSMLAQELNQLKNQWSQFQTSRQQQEQQTLQQEIAQFKKNAPHFDAVRETMSQLLQSGVASDLQSAYDKAIRLHDDIWQKQQDEARQADLAKTADAQRETVAKAKAKAVSPRSSSPTGMMGTGTGKKGLRDILAEQFDAAGGRV